MIIRPAVLSDCAAISAIYNHYVLNETCTYQEDPDSIEERERWSTIMARSTRSSSLKLKAGSWGGRPFPLITNGAPIATPWKIRSTWSRIDAGKASARGC